MIQLDHFYVLTIVSKCCVLSVFADTNFEDKSMSYTSQGFKLQVKVGPNQLDESIDMIREYKKKNQIEDEVTVFVKKIEGLLL